MLLVPRAHDGLDELVCYNTLWIIAAIAVQNLEPDTRTQERDEPIQTAPSDPPPQPASSAGRESSRCTGNKRTAPHAVDAARALRWA
jgi:hypothetical protein